MRVFVLLQEEQHDGSLYHRAPGRDGSCWMRWRILLLLLLLLLNAHGAGFNTSSAFSSNDSVR